MPGWVVSVGLAVLVVLLLLAFGSVELVTVLVILFAWFIVLSSLALSFETLTQVIGRRLRRR
jgi:hypothetical protein